jgi:dihydropteroate synthase
LTDTRHFSIPLPDGRTLELGRRTLVMGILNVTPDSFSDGGLRLDPDAAVAAALQMIEDGADVLDVGGESTRPGAPAVPVDEEWRRLEPVLTRLVPLSAVPISIDTYKADIAERALAAGATIVNDVSGLAYEPALAGVVARRGAAVVLMHNRGRSSTMYAEAHYDDVVAEVKRELAEAGTRAMRAGVAEASIIYDPGLGFAKRAEHSWTLLARMSDLHALGRPILSGPSRKSFLTRAIGDAPPAGRVWATAAAVTTSVLAGAQMVRVHDVKAMVQVVRVADRVRSRVC